MPGFDGTGPSGQGPMTGWGAGRCAGNAPAPGAGFGRGLGRGRGFGRGFGRGLCRWGAAGAPALANAPVSAEDEENVLKNQLSWLQRQVQAIEERLAQVRKTSE